MLIPACLAPTTMPQSESLIIAFSCFFCLMWTLTQALNLYLHEFMYYCCHRMDNFTNKQNVCIQYIVTATNIYLHCQNCLFFQEVSLLLYHSWCWCPLRTCQYDCCLHSSLMSVLSHLQILLVIQPHTHCFLAGVYCNAHKIRLCDFHDVMPFEYKALQITGSSPLLFLLINQHWNQPWAFCMNSACSSSFLASLNITPAKYFSQSWLPHFNLPIVSPLYPPRSFYLIFSRFRSLNRIPRLVNLSVTVDTVNHDMHIHHLY